MAFMLPCGIFDYKNKENQYTGMIGCGVYGWGNEDEPGAYETEFGNIMPPFVGVRPSSKQFLQDWISEKEYKTPEDFLQWIETTDCGPDYAEWKEKYPKAYEEAITDAMKSTVFEKHISSVDIEGATRFNQGDAYIARLLHEDAKNVTTEIGEANQTLMSQAIEAITDDKK